MTQPTALSPDDVAALAGAGVLVAGDLMVDHYVSGQVSRVSDEAPVPIIQVKREEWRPGGAANVAANIAALGGSALLVGVVGEDASAAMLRSVLAERPGLDGDLIADLERPTTVKTRYMGGQHQIVRVDREDIAPLSAATASALAGRITAKAPGRRALVLSDYGKGALTDEVLRTAIAAGRSAGMKIVVDPKRTDWSAYAGADLITPNRKELSLATGGRPCDSDEDCAAAAAIAMRTTGAAILLTRSERGMSLYREGRPALHLPAKAREVFDVSGAGDTVAGTLALGLAAGLPLETAMALANTAAGVVVGKRGTATVSPTELLEEIGPHGGFARTPLSWDAARALRSTWAAQGLSVGFANGCFDILHPGHISLLRQAAAACDRLVVALNTDASVRRLKGPERPAQTERARAEVMAAIRGVDAVVLFDQDTPLDLIRLLEPDVLIKGADYAEDQIVGADLVKARGGRIVRAELAPGQSTTAILGRTGGKTS